MPKVVKLKTGEPAPDEDYAQIDFAEMGGVSTDATLTLVCGACNETIVEGLDLSGIIMSPVYVPCPLCRALNVLDTNDIDE